MQTGVSEREIWKARITAGHIMRNLASELYEDAGACLWELVRNAVIACMKGEGEKWEPGVGEVEVRLVANHPLAPKSTALLIVDRGTGFTKPKIKQYSDIGASLEDMRRGRGSHSGAAQKRVGRFAGLALNRACRDGDPTTGFYLLTRTSDDGPVTLVTLIPSEFERDQGFGVTTIGPNAVELGPYRGLKGSFTIIVIPNAIFESSDEIKKALRWYLPRKRDQMFRLMVDGKPLQPPPLASKVTYEAASTTPENQIAAFIERSNGDDENGGIWFADALTGLRVAPVRSLSPQQVPYPLWRPELSGDIFVPGLLANQRTDRAGIEPRFFRTAAWRHVTSVLVGQVAPKAKALLGDDDVIDGGDFGKLAIEFAALCNDLYGEPEDLAGPPFDIGGVRKHPGGHGGGDGGGHGVGGKREPRHGKPRCVAFTIAGEVYYLTSFEMDELELATVEMRGDRHVLFLNSRRYSAAPKETKARREHMILRVLEAIGRAKFPTAPGRAAAFMAEERRRLLEGKNKSKGR